MMFDVHDLRERRHHAGGVAERIWAAFWRHKRTPLEQLRRGVEASQRKDAGSEGGRSEISVTRVAENDASAARGSQLRAQRVRGRPAFLRDTDGERREVMPARVQDER